MSAKQIIIDASVALKWRLRDEEATSQADALLDDYLAGELGLLTPTLFDYEITNALKVAVTKGRLTENEAITALIDFQAFNIKLYNFQELQTLTFRLAYQHQRSVYDSAYLALAQLKGLWFYIGDKRLFNAVSQTLSWVKWVGDYQLEVIPAS